jgi:serine/threonine protein phosphatase PrpC
MNFFKWKKTERDKEKDDSELSVQKDEDVFQSEGQQNPENLFENASNEEVKKHEITDSEASTQHEEGLPSNSGSSGFLPWEKTQAFSLYLSKDKYDLSLAIHRENSELWSEDAEPLNEMDLHSKSCLLGTFDGMGGAGAHKYQLMNLSTRSGAAIGAALARQVTLSFYRNEFATNISNEIFLKSFHSELESTLKQHFSKEIEELHQNPENITRIKGTLVRYLPTTAAILFVKIVNNKRYFISSVWAGDSINYILTPVNGLQQITLDDFKEPCDSLERIRQGPVLSNMVQACIEQKDYSLNRFDFEMPMETPFILFSCSDGALDYFSNPAELEFNLLRFLLAEDNPEAWKNNLTELFKQVAQDDVSIALRAFGYKDYTQMKLSFQPRFDDLKKMIEGVRNKYKKWVEEHTSNEKTEKIKIQDDSQPNSSETIENNLIQLPTQNEEGNKTSEGNQKEVYIELIEEKVQSSEEVVHTKFEDHHEIELPENESIQKTKTFDLNKEIWEAYRTSYEGFMDSIKLHLGLN